MDPDRVTVFLVSGTFCVILLGFVFHKNRIGHRETIGERIVSGVLAVIFGALAISTIVAP